MPAEATPDVDEAELDRLYAAPLDRFVGEREQLARRLKKEGDSAAAADVRALAKPSVPAWTVNQLARTRRADVRKLLQAGERLRQAQARGAGPDAFRKATEEERRIVSQLVDAAAEILREAGRPASGAVLARVGSTLHAAVGDEEGRRLLEQGRLERDLEPTGFEALAGLVAPAPQAKQRERPSRTAARDRDRVERAKAELREARERARELRRTADEAERAWKRAARESEQAEEAVTRAQKRLDDARA